MLYLCKRNKTGRAIAPYRANNNDYNQPIKIIDV